MTKKYDWFWWVLILGLSVGFNYAWHSVVVAGNYQAELISQTPSSLTGKGGTALDVSLKIKNSGSVTWSHGGSGEVKLATSSPRDNQNSPLYNPTWLSRNRVATFTETEVAPGSVATFNFKVTVPGGKNYSSKFELVAEYQAWFEGFSVPISITVLPTTYSYGWVGQSSPVQLLAGDSTTVWVDLKNTGNVEWQAGVVKLATDRLPDRKSLFANSAWLSSNRVATLDKNVAVGETGRFSFTAVAPAKAGTYKEYFNLVVEGVTWMPSIGLYWQFQVQPATYRAEYIGQVPYSAMAPGETASLWLEVRNAGNVTWKNSGPNAVKLATSRPNDRKSGFQSTSWLSSNRVASAKAETKPGEIARFEFTVTAPDKIGKYKEYFNTVVEGVTWMNDLGVYWNIEVNAEYVVKDPIRVGLETLSGNATVSSTGGFVVRQGAGNDLVKRAGTGVTATVSAVGANYVVSFSDGSSVNAVRPLKFLPTNNSILQIGASGFGSTYNRFRGVIQFDRSSYSGNHWVVNVLDLEDYMKGIAEVPNGWQIEAQKAQMVAARTYAVKLRNGPVADIFDLYDDTRSQVYYGYAYESNNPNLAQAAVATAGIIMKYNGQPISSYYYSDSGGYVESVENVWGKGDPARGIPYLVAKPDPYAKPVIWDCTLTQDYLLDRFSEELADAGAISENITDMVISETFPSGRIKTVIITTASGKVINMPFYTFDYLIPNTMAKSNLFTITKTGATNRPDFLLNGKGNGHGVGLSQYSANNMALQGKTYQDILTFFYTGVVVGSI